MRYRTADDDPQFQEGKKIVEGFLVGKNATGFRCYQEGKDFDTGQWNVEFSIHGVTHKVPLGYASLTNVKSDHLDMSKLAALWESRVQQET